MPAPTNLKKNQKWREAISKKVTKLNPDVVRKLKDAFAIGANVKEACYYAEIAESTYYKWVKENPKLSEEFDLMRQRLPLKAKENIAKSIENSNSIPDSWKLLERKQPDEFAETLNLKNSGEININSEVPPEDQEAIIAFRQNLKQNMLKRRTELAKQKGELPS
jgi:hypothetical protein